MHFLVVTDPTTTCGEATEVTAKFKYKRRVAVKDYTIKLYLRWPEYSNLSIKFKCREQITKADQITNYQCWRNYVTWPRGGTNMFSHNLKCHLNTL
ncbi:hypothetical protein X975_25656, partial [Stegodyphus mimosarum]